MADLIAFLRVLHIITAILMAWPFYALVAVNQRIQLGPPLGDRTDTYMENIIKNRTIPCFVFQATALVTGLALVLLRGLGPGALVTNPMLGLKFLLLVLIAGLLSYVHFSLQPKIDALFAQANSPVPADVAPRLGALRLRRKRLASICMFVVLTVSMLGVQVWAPFALWLTALFVIAIALFTWWAYKSVTPYGWV
ncbi:MAG: hypothetical protein GTN71_19910 [Anaerolineae bacterium]|nr:hypothetical protein [Anaerolineae bacterium]